MAEEWDVYQMLPGADAPVLLTTLYEAREKTIRVELDGCGSGSFAVNRTSPECTEAILAQGNLVRVRIPEIHTDYIFAFFIETGDFTLVSSQEKGGEMLTFGGRGGLSYLEYAMAWSESFIDGGQDPIAGVWRAYAAGTGAAPGQILRRLIEEFQDPDRPQAPLPLLTIDFDYDNDSTTDPWDETDATDEFSYQVGEDGLAIVQRLIDTDTITVQMGADFLLRAYNRDNFGRDLAGDNFGAGIVRFERGVNIATELRRELAVKEASTHMLVGGEVDHYARAVLPGAALLVTKEAFVASFGAGTTALVGVGEAELAKRHAVSDTIMFPIANRRTEVSLGDPVTVGSVVGEDASTGFYLPGPEGTNGDFWVGDTVRVHTGSGRFDYFEVDAVVQAITITRDDDNHELVVIPELQTRASVTTGCTFVQYSGLAASSEDIFGAYLGTTGAFNSGGHYDDIVVDPAPSGTLYMYPGYPNVDGTWGVQSGVIGPATLEASWTWDLDALGTPAICTVMMRASDHGEAFQTLEASNDGTTWDEIVSPGWSSTVPYSTTEPFWVYRYWRLRFYENHPGGYDIGVENEFLMLWAAE